MNKKNIIIGAAAVVVALIAVVVATQWARLKTVASVAQNATMNEEQVTAKSSENEQIVQELEHEFRIPTIELTPEMEAAIADGSMTLEEAASQFLTTPDSAAVSEPDTASPDTGTTTAPDTGTTTTPDTGTTTAPVAEPEPTPEPPAPVTTPEPAPTPEPVAQPEPEPATTTTQPSAPVSKPEPEPEPTAELSGESEPQQSAEAPQQNTAETPQQNTAEAQAPQQSAAEQAQAEQEARVQNLFAQLYVLRSSFNTRIDNLIGECIREFLALDPAEQTRAAKIRIVYNRMDDVTAMEAECDAQVESIAAQLDEIDPALGAKARQYYKNEKDLKKASLIETYGK